MTSFNRRRILTGLGAALAMPAIGRLSFASVPDRPLMPTPRLEMASRGQIQLRMQEGQWSFDGKRTTPTWGFSQDYLGPVLRVRRGSELSLRYENAVSEPVAVHGHGLHVIGELDGGPQRTIAPGDSWSPVLPIEQEASFSWYHAHTHRKTGPQVYKGLAGPIIIDDDNSDSLPLPRRYGIDDLLLIVQDKDFNEDGTLLYNKTGMGRFYAEHVMVNGSIRPRVQVPRGLVRLRLLNASNGRFFNYAFSDGRKFHVIAGDGGFLDEAVEVNSLFTAPGERYEVLVDFSDGLPATMRSVKAERTEDNYALFDPIQGEQTLCYFEVSRRIDADSSARIPAQLNNIARLNPSDAKVRRKFVLQTLEGGRMVINDKLMDMHRIDERVKRGDVEIWELDGDLHNFHVHGCSFQVLSVNGKEPPAHMRSWKDTVIVDEKSSFIVRFDYTAPEEFPYMYHCHLLEHEDMGMMGQFVVYDE